MRIREGKALVPLQRKIFELLHEYYEMTQPQEATQANIEITEMLIKLNHY